MTRKRLLIFVVAVAALIILGVVTATQVGKPRHPQVRPSSATERETPSDLTLTSPQTSLVDPGTSSTSLPGHKTETSLPVGSPTLSANPLAAPGGFYHPYQWTAQDYVKQLKALGRAADAALVQRASGFNTSAWLTGTPYDMDNLRAMLHGDDWEKGALATGQMPVVTLYNIPHRDCGYYSGGGVSPVLYRQWVNAISAIIKNSRITVILEPDAVQTTSCLNTTQKIERWGLIRYAAQTLKDRNPGAVVYIAGVAQQWNIDTHSANLRASGVELTRGVALNVSNFVWTRDCVAIAELYRKKLGSHIYFVIDTSRNGSGPHIDPTNDEAQWCNPPGRTFGVGSTTNTGHPAIDAFLWIKGAGGDGDCWKSQHFDHPYDYILQMAHNTWGR